MSKQLHPAVQVAAATEGFRRAGRVFGRDPQTIPLGELSANEHAAIVADRSLVVMHTAVHLEADQIAALPHRDAEHVKKAKIDAIEPAVSVDQGRLASDLAAMQAYLASVEADLNRRAEELDRIAAEQSARETSLNERAAELERRAQELARQADELDKTSGAAGKTGNQSSKK
ncbi:Ribonuclease Y [Pandoraea captiosa]|uniref:Ribonuclease Y n=1 Tax=Pandoraea captiosa TaxID=2508302 RepID=A0A5E4ZH75_9BURK|nr:hypothetical protein [Pandoraea captiosa]VVE59785.1 Ribonuclease Y [Pandoraea captiosa]